ncbi:MAG: beta-ketoacyl synthase chain length factor [Flavobacteriales bacterium]|nr:beta-ketoacyl synthase chain length factor [Flavobacteriales bacterium]
MFINSSICISYQDSFLKENAIASLRPIASDATLQSPDYKAYVSPAQIRRMSTVLKMGVAAGVEALRQAGDAEADAIIVGTGLGCIQDTLKFVGAMYGSAEGTQSPTAFIQSTHNSIAGQLALLLSNRNYNMTHTQGNLSLACALLDARLLLAEGDAQQVLVGAVDEMTADERAMINALAEKFNYTLPILGEGSAFFHLSSKRTECTLAEVGMIEMAHDGSALKMTHLFQDTDLVLTNSASQVGDLQNIRFTDYCGEFFTAPGFGLWLAIEHLKADAGLQSVMVHHTFGPQEMIIQVKKV